MKITDYREYEKIKLDFLKKHGPDFKIHTSAMDKYSSYYKTYDYPDGAQFTEIMRPVTETVHVIVKKVKCDCQVELLETEYYSTDDSVSRYTYERR